MPARYLFRTTGFPRRFALVLMAACFVLALSLTPASAQTRSTPNSARFQAEVEKSRQRIEEGRRKIEQRRKERKLELPKVKREESSPPPLEYRLAAGRQFAYVVLIEWQSAGKTYRIQGTPFYHVRYENRSNFTTMVIGQFRHSVKSKDDEDFRELPQKDYWAHSVQVLDEHEIVGFGHKAKGALELPFLMSEFVTAPTLIFPTLPFGYGKVGKEEPAVLMQYHDGPTLWDGFTSDSQENTGRVTRYTEASPLGPSLARIDVTGGFVIETTGFSAIYKSQGTFDLAEGLLRESQGVYELKEKGKTTLVTVTVKRLSGPEFDLAKNEALEKLTQLPKDVTPVELARKPLNLFLPDHYSMEEPAPPNQVAGYFDQAMDQYFEVVALKRLAHDQMQIRFQGSGEILTVNPVVLVRLNR